MADDTTLFEQACIAAGLATPGKFIRAFEQAAALLGEPSTVTTRHVRRWWRDIPPPTPRARAWRVIHALLGVDPIELGFLSPPPGATVGGASLLAQEGTSVDRRAFLGDTIGVATAAGLPAPAGRLSAAGRRGSVGTAHLLELRQGLRSLYHLDNAYGGGDVRSLAVRHLCRVRRVINTAQYPETIGRQLQLLAGETAEHCAWLYYDADDQDRARRYWGEALTTATMLRDASLEILVLASLSMQASYEGRPRDGYDLARAAQDRAVRFGSPALQSLLAAREARALCLLGDETAARRRLAESMRLVERTDRGRPAPEWAAFHGPAELEYAQGLLYTEIGHHDRSVQFLRAALDHQDRTYGRNRALYRVTLARSLVNADDVDEGAQHAVQSLGHLEEVESGRVMRRLSEVVHLLDQVNAASARDAADELREYLHERSAA
ncbi:NsdA [Streptomyces sp. NRRL B-3648]|nr:NsdA [Streptomyces sp. NRRL B-3648]